MEIKSKFLCSKGVALAFAMLLGGSPGVLLYANLLQNASDFVNLTEI